MTGVHFPQGSGVVRPTPMPPSLYSPAVSYGFTPGQLAVLRHQILVFRRMKKQDYAIDSETLNQTKPSPLNKVGQF